MKQAYQLKIKLRGFKPSVYRTILVSPDKTFEDLHNYIQQLFDFDGYHLYDFYDKKEDLRIVIDDESYEPGDKYANKTKLKEVLKNEKDKITYTYDFGDSWTFDITLEKIVETKDKLPKVLRGKGGFLIEDCGGVRGLGYLIMIYENKDEKKAENMGYDDLEMLEDELKETIFKEIDWKNFKLED